MFSTTTESEPLPAVPAPLCPECETGWYGTHAGADYAYPVCRCDFAGSTRPAVEMAPAGMEVAGSISAEYPCGFVVPLAAAVEAGQW